MSRWLPLALTMTVGLAAAQDSSEAEAAIAGACRKAITSITPSIVEIEALGGIPKRHVAPKKAPGRRGPGVLAKKGFKQAFGPSTGLIVRADGIIATSTFVLNRKPRHLIVTLHDGRAFVAKLLGRDDSRALALLKIQAKGLPVPRFMKQAEIKVGRYALALGRGLGTAKASASLGIVSAVNRIRGRAIQASAAISPVNYGGPLVGIDGKVMGLLVPLSISGRMASVQIYDSGIGFAIPASDVVALVPRLSKGLHLEPGFLGVVPDASHRGQGVRVKSVFPGSPAQRAGLKTGDVILQINKAKVDALWRMRRELAKRYAGDRVELEVKWQTKTRTVKLRLTRRPRGPFGFPGRRPAPRSRPAKKAPPAPKKKKHDEHDGHDHGKDEHP